MNYSILNDAPSPGISPATLGSGNPPYPGYPPATYPPAEGYPQPGIPMTHQPPQGAGYPPPGSMQPGSEWMPLPTDIPISSQGLEYLTMIDQFVVHKIRELEGEVSCCETRKNMYAIKNSMGQKIYTAEEEADCCNRNLCIGSRAFDLKLKDNADMEVIHLTRGFGCDGCCCPGSVQPKIEVFAPPGQLIGVVVKEWSICNPSFRVEDERGETVFKLQGPTCCYAMCNGLDFQVLSTSGDEIGKVSKQVYKSLREVFKNPHCFGIAFPLHLDVKKKALLLGALFLIDYLFYAAAAEQEEYKEAHETLKHLQRVLN